MSSGPRLTNQTDVLPDDSLESLASVELGPDGSPLTSAIDTDTVLPPSPLRQKIRLPVTVARIPGSISTAGLESAMQLREAQSLDNARRIKTLQRLERLKDSPALVEQLRAKKEKAISGESAPYGLFKNPYFKYRGGLVSKLLTFFANIVKFIELLVLRLLSGPKNDGSVVMHQKTPTSAEQNSASTLNAEAKLKKEREERMKRIDVHGVKRS